MRQQRTDRLALLALSLFGVAALNCECDPEVSRLPEPEIEVLNAAGDSHTTADPWLTVSFGDVDAGASQSQVLTLRNSNTGTLTLGNICLVASGTAEEATRDGAPCLQLSSTPFSFAPLAGTELAEGEEAELSITFSPDVGGPVNLFVRIESNATTEPVVAVEITGRGTAGRLCTEQTILDFGDVYVGAEKTLPISLVNCGVRPVDIEAFMMLQNPDDAFTVAYEGGPVATPIGPLNEGESILLEVTFAPAQARIYRDTLAGIAQLTTAAPFFGEYQLLFVGDGVTPPTCRVNVVPQTVQFGAVASNNTATQDIIVQSVGDCACQITEIAGPTPGDAGFTIDAMPSLPFTLAGGAGCEGDPADAATAPDVLYLEVTYTAPDRASPAIDNATVDVTTTDEMQPTRTVSLEANGGGTPFCQLDVTPTGGGILGLPAVGRDGVAEFGRVTIYGAKNIPIELTNVGNDDCTIDSIEWLAAPNTQLNEFDLTYEDGTPVPVGSASPITVPAGATQRFMARFAPTHVIESSNPFDVFNFGSYSASYEPSLCVTPLLMQPTERCNGVAFHTSDTLTPTENGGGVFSIGFQATPVEPAIDVIPGSLDFGLVTLGCGSPEQRVTVYNTGSGDLVVGEPYVNPPNNPADFVVTAVQNPTGTWPFTIAPGASMGIFVRYYANEVGVVTGELVIPTIEGDQEAPPVTVPLSGEGTLETEQTDIFDQFNDPKVDVLFVVDDSGSMQPFQQLMADNFDAFFTSSNVSASDYHIAVTTTLTTDGNCVDPFGIQTCELHEMCGWYTSCSGNDRFLTPASSDPEGQFECNVIVSENRNPSRPTSDSAEGALQAARKFLEAPNIDDPGINGGFMRDDAKLHIVLVSDEPDQSEGPIDLYIDFFRNLKGFRNDSLIAVSGIASPTNGCTMTDGTQLSGDARYETVVDEMNGRFQPICDADWTTMMQNLGLDSLGLQIEFFLTRAADAATLEVCVRETGLADPCVPVSQTDDMSTSGYFYDPLSNSIVFNPLSVPQRGARIEVHYEAFCY